MFPVKTRLSAKILRRVFGSYYRSICSDKVLESGYEFVAESPLLLYMVKHGRDKRIRIEVPPDLTEILELVLARPVRPESRHERQGEFLAGIVIYHPVERDDSILPFPHYPAYVRSRDFRRGNPVKLLYPVIGPASLISIIVGCHIRKCRVDFLKGSHFP